MCLSFFVLWFSCLFFNIEIVRTTPPAGHYEPTPTKAPSLGCPIIYSLVDEPQFITELNIQFHLGNEIIGLKYRYYIGRKLGN